MTVSIAFSISNIVDNLLADAALRHFAGPPSPHLLTRDQQPALARMIRPEIVAIALETGASVAAPEGETEAQSDIFTLQFELAKGVEPVSLRLLIEQAVAGAVAAKIYAVTDPSLAGRFETIRRTALACMRGCVGRSARIVPSPL